MVLQRSQDEMRSQGPRSDEVHEGVAAPPTDAGGPIARTPDGRVASSEAAAELGRRSARARAENVALVQAAAAYVRRLLPEEWSGKADEVAWPIETVVKPFVDEGNRWFRATVREAMATTGGGRLAPDVTALYEAARGCRTRAKIYEELTTTRRFFWIVDGEKVTPRTDLADLARKEWLTFGQLITRARDHAAQDAQVRMKNAGPADYRRRILGAAFVDDDDADDRDDDVEHTDDTTTVDANTTDATDTHANEPDANGEGGDT